MAPPARSPIDRQRRALAFAVAAGTLVGSAAAAPVAKTRARMRAAAAGPAKVNRLPSDVEAALLRHGIPVEAMVAWVQDVDGKPPELAWQADKKVNPASLMKLLTTYAALDLLGPAYSWSTPVWLNGPISNGVLNGDLVIKGTGDPKLVVERLWLLMRRVQQAGVREIRGNIVVDRSAFAPGEVNPADFDGEPLRPYNASADALLLNFRAVVLTFTPDTSRGVASVGVDPPLAGVSLDATVPLVAGACDDWRGVLKGDFSDPNRLRLAGSYQATCGEKAWPIAYVDGKSFHERALLGMWHELGGKLSGNVREGVAPASAPSFALLSPPLADVIRDINKVSNNVMAQQVFLTLGYTQRGLGSPAQAREVLRGWLRDKVGETSSAAVISNGSGLSRDGRVSAGLLGQLLVSAWASPVMSELMSSLPVAGIDGTLRKSKSPQGRAHLKTGSLRDVSGVAGYVDTDSGPRRVVVGIVNHANAAAAKPALEALTRWATLDAPAP